MYDFLFGAVHGLIGKRGEVVIDNLIFRLHYRASFIVLIAASILVTSKQYIGDPIDCMADSIDGGIMDVYCWIHSTFSVPKRMAGTTGVDHVNPGAGPLDLSGDPVRHHKYYQWVVFVLTLQAVMFYAPRVIWKTSEGGVMKTLTGGLNDVFAYLDVDKRRDGVEVIAKYFDHDVKRSQYFLKFAICEILNFVNVIGQIFLTDRFLGNQFTDFGLDVITQSEADLTLRGDTLNKVFPKIAKCNFHKYGPTGTIEVHDALCVLPLNIINEKIYVFLWFWFVFLGALTGLWMIYRILTIFIFNIRVNNIHRHTAGLVPKHKVSAVLSNPDHDFFQKLGDYLLIHFIAKNLSPLILKDVFDAITPELPDEKTDILRDVDGDEK